MLWGATGGDVMKGFGGDDIMVGQGSFTSSSAARDATGGSYEFAPHGVSMDMNLQEFVSPIGTENTIRDIWQHT